MRASRLVVALVVCLVSAQTGCIARDLDWDVRFEPTSLQASTVRLDARIARGGCDTAGEVLWTATLEPRGPVGDPPELPSGVYCFSALAGDASCQWIAAGQTEVSLPMDDGAVIGVVVRDRAPTSNCETTCMAGQCARRDAGADPDRVCVVGGCTQTCDDDCDASCTGGRCAMRCEGTSNCSFDCTGGGCTIECVGTSNCNASCVGGGCTMRCRALADCDFGCTGGGCELDCEDPGSCTTSCLPMDCTGP